MLAILAAFLILAALVHSAEPPPYRDFLPPIRLLMPSVKVHKADDYLCTYSKVTSEEAFIVEFTPWANLSYVHHMLLYGCGSMPRGFPQPKMYSWGCKGFTCTNMTVLYSWAKGAKPIQLPRDVGFRVGLASGIRAVVLQVHYSKPLEGDGRDHSGIVLQLASQKLPYTAGIYVLSNSYGSIPPGIPNYHLDANCPLVGDADIHPFAFRVHAHSLGTVISGYHGAADGTLTLIARGSPQEPQGFYPILQQRTIHPGEFLAARCSYNSTGLNSSTEIGFGSNNEMCNLYLMFYVETGSGPTAFYHCNRVTVPGVSEKIPLDNPSAPRAIMSPFHNHHFVDLPQTGGQPKTAENMGQPSEELPRRNPKMGEMVPLPASTNPQTSLPRVNKKDFSSMSDQQTSISPDPKFRYQEVKGWEPVPSKLGQVSGVAVDPRGRVVIFHRGSHIWGGHSFSLYERYQLVDNGPISEATVLTLDPDSGRVVHQWGQNLFYLPHGLTIQGEHVWLTDVAMHQIFKFPLEGAALPLLTLGEKFEPGSDQKHFCKPTSVAVDSQDDIYVADGYCNSRIIVFSKDGAYLRQWGQKNPLGVSSPPLGAFEIPHKLVMTGPDSLCVADRENGRIQCSNLQGQAAYQIASDLFHHTLYSIAYNPLDGGLLYAVCGPSYTSLHSVQGFVFNLTSRQLLATFAPQRPQEFSQPHDLAVTPDAEEVYVVEIGPNNVWKFNRGDSSQQPHKSLKKVLPTESTLSQQLGGTTQEPADLAIRPLSPWSPSVVLAILGVPVLILVLVVVVMRLRARDRLSLSHVKGWLGGYGSPHYQPAPSRGDFSLGRLLRPSHHGFDRVALEESGESGSEVEEFSSQSRKA